MKIIHIVDDFLFELFPKANVAGNKLTVKCDLNLPIKNEHLVASKMVNEKNYFLAHYNVN